MSGIYAYCVVPGGRRPPEDLHGLGDEPVAVCDVEDLSLWCSRAEQPPPLDLEAVSRHHAVVSAALGEAVLPLRFGAWHPSMSALADRIRESSPQLTAALERVGSRVELGIRIVHSEGGNGEDRELSTSDETVSGREYLRTLSRLRDTRVERRREQNELVRRLQEHLGEMAAEQRVRYLSPPELVSVAHLVEAGDERRYRERAAEFAGNGDVVVHVTGPWPPYSFAS